MGSVDIDSMMLVLHVFMFASHFLVYIMLVLCYAYHAHGKMSYKHFLVILWIS